MLDLKQIKDLDELLDQIYEESQNNQVYTELIKFATINFDKSQLRKMENLVFSINNLSDLKNFIKNQVGKDTKNTWTGKIEWKDKAFGQLLLEEINKVEQKARNIHDSLEFRLKVVRGFINQFVSEYLFQKEVKSE